jgi:hypothetical protein
MDRLTRKVCNDIAALAGAIVLNVRVVGVVRYGATARMLW